MGFKTTPSGLAIVRTFIENLPRRASGRPPLDPSIRDPEICNSAYQDMITKAFNYVRLLIPRINAMGGECVTLATCLSGKSVSSVYITCAGCAGRLGSYDRRVASSIPSANSLQLCLAASGSPANQATVNSLVFRELIRLCWGEELDALGLDYYFTAVDTSGPAPVYWPVPQLAKDFMCAGSTSLDVPGTVATSFRVGTFIVWNPLSGTLFAKQRLSAGSGIGGSGWGYVLPSLTGNLGHTYWTHSCP